MLPMKQSDHSVHNMAEATFPHNGTQMPMPMGENTAISAQNAAWNKPDEDYKASK